jgi:predicted metal-dependent hydrolase
MRKRTLSLASGEVEVNIVRSSRRTVALYVQPGGTLLIRAPWYVPLQLLMQFAAHKSPWIERQVSRLKHVTPPGTPVTIIDGGTVPFMGRELTVTVRHGSARRVSHNEDGLILNVTRDPAPEDLTNMTEAWYLREAKAYLPERTRRLAEQYSHLLPAPGTISVRKMKRRWGTCHTGGAIWLNRELMKKSPDLIDYVIIHELCHLVHHNHGREYYELLSRILPDFRELRKRLQQ